MCGCWYVSSSCVVVIASSYVDDVLAMLRCVLGRALYAYFLLEPITLTVMEAHTDEIYKSMFTNAKTDCTSYLLLKSAARNMRTLVEV